VSPVAALTSLRLGIGTGAWVAPRLAGRVFGLDPAANPQLPYVGRLFGARDVALAVGAQVAEGETRRLWLQLGVACDLADAVAGLIAGRNGSLSPLATVLVTVPAVAAAGLGAKALRGPNETVAPAG
jgi:hypothetical protein